MAGRGDSGVAQDGEPRVPTGFRPYAAALEAKVAAQGALCLFGSAADGASDLDRELRDRLEAIMAQLKDFLAVVSDAVEGMRGRAGQ
jgi:hypothetical protein